MSAARAKGTAWETAIVGYLRGRGAPHAERRALNGSNDRGDIAGIPGLVIERGCVVNELELEIEDIARTVVCPTCGARRGRACRYTGIRGNKAIAQNYSHTGRLKTARGEAL